MKGELTAALVAERLGVGRSTVNLWCRQGLFPTARREESPLGPYWIIPEADLKDFTPPRRGRTPIKIGGEMPKESAKKKAISRWENEGGAGPPKKKGGLPATPKFGSISTQTKTTRRLDQSVKRVADKEMGGEKKGGKK